VEYQGTDQQFDAALHYRQGRANYAHCGRIERWREREGERGRGMEGESERARVSE
jgi:hypothetical protein